MTGQGPGDGGFPKEPDGGLGGSGRGGRGGEGLAGRVVEPARVGYPAASTTVPFTYRVRETGATASARRMLR